MPSDVKNKKKGATLKVGKGREDSDDELTPVVPPAGPPEPAPPEPATPTLPETAAAGNVYGGEEVQSVANVTPSAPAEIFPAGGSTPPASPPTVSVASPLVRYTFIFMVARHEGDFLVQYKGENEPECTWTGIDTTRMFPNQKSITTVPLQASFEGLPDVKYVARVTSPGKLWDYYDIVRPVYASKCFFVTTKRFNRLNSECSGLEYRDAIIAALRLVSQQHTKFCDNISSLIDELACIRKTVDAWPDLREGPAFVTFESGELLPGSISANNPMEPKHLVLWAVKVDVLRGYFRRADVRLYLPTQDRIIEKLPADSAAVESILHLVDASTRRIVVLWVSELILTLIGADRTRLVLHWYAFVMRNVTDVAARSRLRERLRVLGLSAEFFKLYGPLLTADEITEHLRSSTSLADVVARAAEFSVNLPVGELRRIATAVIESAKYRSILQQDRDAVELTTARDLHSTFTDEDSTAWLLAVLRSPLVHLQHNVVLSAIPPQEAVRRVLWLLKPALLERTERNVQQAAVTWFKDFHSRLGGFIATKDPYERVECVHRVRCEVADAFTNSKSITAIAVDEDLLKLVSNDDEHFLARFDFLRDPTAAAVLPSWLLSRERFHLVKMASGLSNPRLAYRKVRKPAQQEQSGTIFADSPFLATQLMEIFLSRNQRDVCSATVQPFLGALLAQTDPAWFTVEDGGAAFALYQFSQEARDFYDLVTKDASVFPNWSQRECCAAASKWTKAVDDAAKQLAVAVTGRHCTCDLVVALVHLKPDSTSHLAKLATFDPAALDHADTYQRDIVAQWAEALDAYRSAMEGAEAIRVRLNEVVNEVTRQYHELLTLPLKMWKPPASTKELREAAAFFQGLLRSRVAKRVYDELLADVNNTAPAAATADEAIKLWIALLQRVKVRWCEVVNANDSATAEDVYRYFFRCLPGLLNAVDAQRTVDQAQSRQRTQQEADRTRRECFVNVRRELETVIELLPRSVLKIPDLDAAATSLQEALLALTSIPVVRAAVDCCRELKVALARTSPEIRFHELSDQLATVTGRQLAVALKHITAQRYHALLTPAVFFLGLRDAVTLGRLVELCAMFPGSHGLSQAIMDRTNHAEPRDLEALTAFEIIHKAFSATEGVQQNFVLFAKRQIPSSDRFFHYAEEVSWCADTLHSASALLPRVMELLDDQVDHDNAVDTALELSLPTSVFTIQLERPRTQAGGATFVARATMRATTEKRGKDKPLSSADLEDLFFQLTLAGSHADQGNADVISGYVAKYITVKHILKLCEDLQHEGHPRFQQQTVRCEMRSTTEELDADVRQRLEDELASWRDFKLRAETRYPLLAFLQPHELCECLGALDRPDQAPDIMLLTTTLVHAALPLTPRGEVQKAITTVLEGDEATNDARPLSEWLRTIHRILEIAMATVTTHLPTVGAGGDPAPYRTAVNEFRDVAAKFKIMDQLAPTNNSTDVVVLQLGEGDACLSSTLAIALYAALFDRVPLAVEMLNCEASTEHAPSYVRRWGTNLSLTEMSHQLMFCVSGAERLSAKAQAALLDSILHRRSTRGADDAPLGAERPSNVLPAKLVVIVADQNQDTLLSTQLRQNVLHIPFEVMRKAENVVQLFCQAAFVTVVSSEFPSSGKTLAAMRTAREIGCRFGSAITDGSTQGFVEAINAVNQSRRADECIVLHVSVAHNAVGHRVNDQILEFVVFGRVTDGRRHTALRLPNDHTIVELPSQGQLHTTFRRETPVLRWFQQTPVPAAVTTDVLRLAPSDPFGTLHSIREDHDANEKLVRGFSMLMAYDVATTSGVQQLMHHERMDRLQLGSEAALTALVVKHSTDFNAADFGTRIRFVKFLTSMLAAVYAYPAYAAASEEMELMDHADGGQLPQARMHNYRAMAFFLVRFSIDTAEHFAGATVPPAQTEHVDESSRLEKLTLAFENLRRPFALFTGDTYEFVSTDGDDVDLATTFNLRWNQRAVRGASWDSDFHAFANHMAQCRTLTTTQALRTLASDGQTAGLDCFGRVLPVLGLRANFGIALVESLRSLESEKTRHKFTQFTDIIPACFQSNVLAAGNTELQAVCPQWIEKVRSMTATVGDFDRYARRWLNSLTASPQNESPPFVLTQDSLVRLLSIKTRLQCGMPVILQGETGQGKTHLLSHFAKVTGTLFEIINVHRGVTAAEIAARIEDVSSRLERQRQRVQESDPDGGNKFQPMAVVLLDEVNAMESVWIAKSLVCDRLILGRAVPPEIHFVCVMNPWRRREAQQTPGLDFVDSIGHLGDGAKNVQQQQQQPEREHLVYDVHRSPESFMALVWDFGLPFRSFELPNVVQTHLWRERCSVPREWGKVTDENIFAESSMSWHLHNMMKKASFNGAWALLNAVGDVNGTRHFLHLRTLMMVLIDVAQNFMRDHAGGDCAVSLRDIARTTVLIPFLYEVQVNYAECHDQVLADHQEPFRMLQRSVAAAFVLNYILRLPDQLRVALEEALLNAWRTYRSAVSNAISPAFLAPPATFYADFDGIAEKVCECLVIDQGMAVNCALKENVLSLFSSIMHPSGNLAQIIVGRPGSTKSASLDALVVSSDRACTDVRGRFFRYWKPIKKFVIQCTRETTANAILRVARSAAMQQRIRDQNQEPCQCVLVLEEVGIAVGSRHNPLMVLHSLIDRGVTLDDGTVIRLPIIGISNYSLDAAKMNRMRTTFRGNPSLPDLVSTARALMRQQARVRRSNDLAVGPGPGGRGTLGGPTAEQDDAWVTAFATTFRDLILSDDAEQPVRWFYGMRDFYSFVSMMKRHLENRLADEYAVANPDRRSFFSHLVHWALQVNFGGHPDASVCERVRTAFTRAIFDMADPASQASWRTMRDVNGHLSPVSHVDPMQDPRQRESAELSLCDICARMLHYDGRRKAPDVADPAWFPFRQITRSGVPCHADNSVADAGSILAYALHRDPLDVTRLYRVRNVLLFSRGNAGVELLFRLGLVKREEAEVIDPRDPTQLTPQQIMSDLARVRRCLRTNRTLIMVRATHLYEAMFDVLNQHFAIEQRGDKCCFYSTLTMDGFTSVVPVSPDHRIILVEDEVNMGKLTSPFLNRCVKVHLGFETALNPQQRRLFHAMKTRFTVNRDDDKPVLVPSLVVPGFGIDTLASIALSAKLAPDCEPNDILDAVDAAHDWLRRVICPRRLHQVRFGLLPGVDPRLLDGWGCPLGATLLDMLGRQEKDDFDECSEELSSTASEDKPNPVEQHLLVFTEQRGIRAPALQAALEQVFEDATMWPLEPLHANFIGDDELDPYIVNTAAAKDEHTFVVFVIDLTTLSGSAGAAKLDGLIHRVVAKAHPTRHVTVLAIMPSTADPVNTRFNAGGWGLTHRDGWTVVSVDEVTPPDQPPITVKLLVEDHGDATSDDDGAAQAMVAARGTRTFEVILERSFLAVGTHRARAIAQNLGVGKDVERLEAAVRTCIHPTTSPVFETLRDFVVQGVVETTDLAHRWQHLAYSRVRVADSLREQLTAFFLDVMQHAMHLLLPQLFEGSNYLHADRDGPTWHIFDALLRSPLMPGVDYQACAEGELLLSGSGTVVRPIELEAERSLFPFSSGVQRFVSTLPRRDVMLENYDRIFPAGTPVGRELVTLYVQDVVRARTEAPPHECAAVAELLMVTLDATDSTTLVDVHTYLDVDRADWLSAAREWARGFTHHTAQLAVMELKQIASNRANYKTGESEAADDDDDAATEEGRPTPSLGDVLLNVASNPLMSLTKVSAIERLLGDASPWRLRMFRALALMPEAAAQTHLTACRDPSEVVNLLRRDRYLTEHSRPIIAELLDDVELTEGLLALLESLLQLAAEPNTAMPKSVFAFVMRSTINLWRDAKGVPAAAFFATLYDRVHYDSCGDFAILVSRCFFDVMVDAPALMAQALAKLEDPAGTEKAAQTFHAVARTGIDTACASVVADAALRRYADFALSRPIPDKLLARLGQQLRTQLEGPRGDQTVVFLLRQLYREVNDLAEVKRILEQDRRHASPLFPVVLLENHIVQQAFSVRPPPSLFYVMPRFEAVNRLLQTAGNAIPADEQAEAVAAAALQLSLDGAPRDTVELTQRVTPRIAQIQVRLLGALPAALRALTLRDFTRDLVGFVASIAPHCPFIDAALAHAAPPPTLVQTAQPAERHAASGWHAARVMDFVVALLHAALRPPAQVDPAALRGFVDQARDNILTIRCPGCRTPFDGFDGCFHVMCRCGATFCGWCLTTMPDAHQHSTQCELNTSNRGSYHGNMQHWNQANNARRIVGLKRLLNTVPSAAMKAAIVAELAQDLRDVGINIDAIGVQPALTSPMLAERVEAAVGGLARSLFGGVHGGESDAAWWVAISLQEKHRALGHRGDIEQHLRSSNERNPRDTVQNAMQRALEEGAVVPAVASIQQTHEFLDSLQALSDDRKRAALESHYLYRKPNDVSQFWATVEADEAYAPLRPLHAAVTQQTHSYHDAESNARYCRILNFLGDLQLACTKWCITRHTARTMTLAAFTRQYGDAPEFDAWHVNQFVTDLDAEWLRVERVFCKTRAELINGAIALDMIEADKLTLNMLLPTASDTNTPDGGFIYALLNGRAENATAWKGLFESSTQTIEALRRGGAPAVPDVSHRLYRLAPHDLVNYDEEFVMNHLVPLYLDPSPEGGFTADLHSVVQQVLALSGVGAKPMLRDATGAFPTFTYPDEAASSVVALFKRTGLVVPSAEVARAVRQLAVDDPEFRMAAVSFLHVLIRELAATNDRLRLPPLFASVVDGMATPLTPQQRRARDAIRARAGAGLRTAHLVPLLAHLWDGRVTQPALAELTRDDDAATEGLAEEIRNLFASGREDIAMRFLDSARIAAVLYLQPGQQTEPHLFEGSILELVLRVNSDDAFEHFASLDTMGNLSKFAALTERFRDLFEGEAQRRHDAGPATTAPTHGRSGFAMRVPISQADYECDDVEPVEDVQASDAQSVAASRSSPSAVPKLLGLAAPRSAASATPSARPAPSTRLATQRANGTPRLLLGSAASVPQSQLWAQDPHLDYGDLN
jgi:hypothetical protein